MLGRKKPASRHLLEATSVDGQVSVLVSGELDIAAVAEFTDFFGANVPAGSTVNLDLADVTFIDSTGLGALLHVVETMREDGSTVTVVRAAGQALRLFDQAGVRDRLMGNGTDGALPGW